MNVRLWNEELRLCTETLVKSGVQNCLTHTYRWTSCVYCLRAPVINWQWTLA